MGVVCEAIALGCCEAPEDEGVNVILVSPEVGVAVISVVVAGPVDNDCDTAPVSVVGETDVSGVDCVNCRRRGVCITGREGIYMKYE